jgi:DNA repair exonuclease SbcCD ATPase subunit
MKTNGIQLMASIKKLQKRRDLLQSQFEGSLQKFDDEKKRDPVELAAEIERYERQIADLQAAQSVLNSKVRITVDGQEMSLLAAVKQVGGAERIVSLWTGVATAGAKQRERYGFMDRSVRNKDQETAKDTVSADKAIEMAQVASERASALRAAISYGNAVDVELGFEVTIV